MLLHKLWDRHFDMFVLACYWFLGLCNNFAYVIMLSAAHDILEPHNKTTNASSSQDSTSYLSSPFYSYFDVDDDSASFLGNKSNKYDCNDLSTGTILLADILPGFVYIAFLIFLGFRAILNERIKKKFENNRIVIKLLAPFFVHKIKYNMRVILVVIVNASSFLLVSLVPSEYKWLIFVGVMCASLSASFGEITFLSMSTLYNRRYSLTGWGSGTGAAGYYLFIYLLLVFPNLK